MKPEVFQLSRLLAVLAWLCWATLAIADPLVPGAPPTSCTIASCNIGVATGTSLALGGGSIGSDVFEATGTSTHNGNLTVAGASLILSGNQSAAAWTTNGVRLKGVSATMTDTTSSGTVAAAYTDVLGGNTIAASSATTYTKYAALRINAPVAGTNVTFTNAPALDVASETIGGATLGTNALAVTGTVTINGGNGLGTSSALVVNGGATLGVINLTSNGRSGFLNVDGAGSFGVSFGSTGADVTSLVYSGTGKAAIYSSGLMMSSTSLFGFSSSSSINNSSVISTILSQKAAATLQHGAADAATSVPQIETYQGIAPGTSNTSASNTTIIASLSTGSGTSGDYTIQTGGTGAGATVQNTAVNALIIKGGTQQVRLPQITSDAAQTDATICEDTTNHALFSGSGTLGICLGTSSARYKHDVSDLGVGLHAIMGLQPKRYFLDRQHGDPAKPYYGFLAEDGVGVLPELVGNDNLGRPNTFDYLGIVPILVRAVQEQQAEIEALRRVMR